MVVKKKMVRKYKKKYYSNNKKKKTKKVSKKKVKQKTRKLTNVYNITRWNNYERIYYTSYWVRGKKAKALQGT